MTWIVYEKEAKARSVAHTATLEGMIAAYDVISIACSK
jgi:hypothetical protein